ncbi:hypothetical protein PG993_013352 [Apiospora rasikravindrae]|uniref:Uncharacterized protein n=1 Tax=Apiospora rasikravindrae TaxID=990691 RepID=A0ABR1RXE4_9PEZI
MAGGGFCLTLAGGSARFALLLSKEPRFCATKIADLLGLPIGDGQSHFNFSEPPSAAGNE